MLDVWIKVEFELSSSSSLYAKGFHGVFCNYLKKTPKPQT